MGGNDQDAWEERALGILSVLPTQPKSILDFGAGEGQLVAAFRRLGFVANGVEPNDEGRRSARERLGVDLLAQTAESGPYDLVTALHVLEHMQDPAASLRDLARTAGHSALLFLEVPHGRSVDLLWPSQRERLLQLPGHLFHFTPEALDRLLPMAGWRPLRWELSNPMLLEWMLGVRRRLASRPASPPNGDGHAVPPRGERSWLRRVWRTTLLPQLRRRFPGWRIQVVAST